MFKFSTLDSLTFLSQKGMKRTECAAKNRLRRDCGKGWEIDKQTNRQKRDSDYLFVYCGWKGVVREEGERGYREVAPSEDWHKKREPHLGRNTGF